MSLVFDFCQSLFSESIVSTENNYVVAYDENKAYDLNDLQQQVIALTHGLLEEKEQTWALFYEHSWDFLVAFLSLSLAGKDIVIPGNFQQDTQDKLNDICDGVLADQSFVAKTSEKKVNIQELTPKDISVSVFTSGSTGEPKLIEKRLSNFEREVDSLESLWGDVARECQFVATVSHQHIYGFLFKILWPLLQGRKIYLPLIQYPEELLATEERATILISSPAQLKRLPQSNQISKYGKHVKQVFSSGGALALLDNERARDALGQPITEVLGSSETGGVAWRQLNSEHDDATWALLPEVELSFLDGEILINSPHVFSDLPVAMGDKGQLTKDGRLELKGRVDRIVKLEEKRVSLDSMEAKLLSHEWVAVARVLMLKGKRDVLGAVIVLTAEGKKALLTTGKKNVVKAAKQYLLSEFERVLLPRKWRFVDELPVNEQGKMMAKSLLSLFSHDSFLADLPLIESEKREDNKVTLQLMVPETLSFFSGHFPKVAILPGVIQFSWVVYFAELFFDKKLRLQSMDRIKFQSIVRPRDKITLKLKWQEDKQIVSFEYLGASGGKVSSGRLSLLGIEE